jgi:hypothetical protein
MHRRTDAEVLGAIRHTQEALQGLAWKKDKQSTLVVAHELDVLHWFLGEDNAFGDFLTSCERLEAERN